MHPKKVIALIVLVFWTSVLFLFGHWLIYGVWPMIEQRGIFNLF